MNNEPVAWMHKTYFQNGLYEEDLVWSKIDESSIPLYTHPSTDLTDEEIAKIKADAIRWLAQEHFDECLEDRPIQHWIRKVADKVEDGFFDAILRKAQE